MQLLRDPQSMGGSGRRSQWVALVVLRLLAIALHECAHLLAAIALGWEGWITFSLRALLPLSNHPAAWTVVPGISNAPEWEASLVRHTGWVVSVAAAMAAWLLTRSLPAWGGYTRGRNAPSCLPCACKRRQSHSHLHVVRSRAALHTKDYNPNQLPAAGSCQEPPGDAPVMHALTQAGTHARTNTRARILRAAGGDRTNGQNGRNDFGI